MFCYDRGIYLKDADLWLDARCSKPLGYVSHAHSDHIAPHKRILATPETLKLCGHRLGKRPEQPLPYRQPFDCGSFRLTTYPAGHILGSAMLLVETPAGERLLYTGDFRLRPARTCVAAEVPQADVLIMESTYGHPRYRFPNRKGVEEDFVAAVQQAIDRGVTPVVFAYSLGKSQEIIHLLTGAGLSVMAHESICDINDLYEEMGVAVGPCARWRSGESVGRVCLLPPLARGSKRMLGRVNPRVTMQLTGWALDVSGRYRLGVDRAFPFSDHADYDELLELLDQVRPRVVYCTHGPAEFADRLRDLGWDARPLAAEAWQTTLF